MAALAAALPWHERAEIQTDRHDSQRLRRFVQAAWHVLEPDHIRPFVAGWHVDAICDHLTAVSNGHIRRLLINVPPGFSKSWLTCVAWQAWEWGPLNRPWIRELTASYSAALSERDATRMRMLVGSPWYQQRWPHVRINPIIDSKTRFATVEGGWRIATSVEGMGTGERSDRFVIDDPHNVKQAESDLVRGATLTWFRETIPTRMNDPEKSAIVVIMQRVHADDVSGRAIELGYDHLMLPMRFEADRACRTRVAPGGRAMPKGETHLWDRRTVDGQLLDTGRFPLHVVDELETTLQSYATASQHQQRPTPRGGGMIEVGNLEIVDDYPREATICRRWDFAATDPKHMSRGGDPDWTAGAKVVMRDGVTWIADIRRDRKSPREVQQLIRQTAELDGQYVPVLLEQEPGSSGKANVDTYHRDVLLGWAVEARLCTGSKVDRCNPFASAVGAGNVKLVRGSWNEDFLAEARDFPFGRHDDQIDAVADAYLWLAERSQRLMVGGR